MPTLVDAIAQRRSTRQFQPRPVAPEQIDAMLRAANLAPRACNISHFRVIVVEEEPDLEFVRRAAYSMGAVAEAPLVLVLLADTSLDEAFLAQMNRPDSGFDAGALRSASGKPFHFKVGREWALVNAAIAGEHMMLQAVEMGLGGCWVHHVEHADLREHFGLPDHMEILSLMAIGHPIEKPQASERTDHEDLRYEIAR